MQQTEQVRDFGALVSLTIAAECASEAREYIESHEWITDRSEWSAQITPIFYAMREGVITQNYVMGIAPIVSAATTDVMGTTHTYHVSCWLRGTAATREAFDRYVNSLYWLNARRVCIQGISNTYAWDTLDVNRHHA